MTKFTVLHWVMAVVVIGRIFALGRHNRRMAPKEAMRPRTAPRLRQHPATGQTQPCAALRQRLNLHGTVGYGANAVALASQYEQLVATL
jgi:hypothetical protein